MKFRKFGKTVLTAALSSAIVFSLSSCVRSFTVGYLYVTGTVTATPSGNGIISGFKIDNNTGKLLPLHGGIVASGGANPIRAVLLTGGRFLYVLNQGATASGGSNCSTNDPCTGANITQFLIGGNGILTPQQTFQTQGINPIRLISDTSGNFLYVLDHDAPAGSSPYCEQLFNTAACGDITAFAINPTTGRLSLVVNATLTAQNSNTQVTYFPVPANPIDFAMVSSYVMTLAGAPSSGPNATADSGYNATYTAQTVYPYSYTSTNGQLGGTNATVQSITNGAGNKMGQGTAFVFAGGKVYILDNEPFTAGGTPGQILPFTPSGSNGNLGPVTGGAIADDPNETSPIWLIVESKSKFLYVANQQGASVTTGAGIAAYTINPDSSLTEAAQSPFLIPNSTNGSGAVPECLIEDPSDQFIYTANSGDSTVTGLHLDPNSGALRQLSGSTGVFALTGPATWCVETGRTN